MNMREKECAYWVLRGISPEEGRKWREEGGHAREGEAESSRRSECCKGLLVQCEKKM